MWSIFVCSNISLYISVSKARQQVVCQQLESPASAGTSAAPQTPNITSHATSKFLFLFLYTLSNAVAEGIKFLTILSVCLWSPLKCTTVWTQLLWNHWKEFYKMLGLFVTILSCHFEFLIRQFLLGVISHIMLYKMSIFCL